MGDRSNIPDQLNLNPAACRARKAASRPAPGPFIKTSTVRIPCSMALLAAVLRGQLGGERGAFAGPLKPLGPRAGPGHHISNRIGNGNDGIIESGLDMGNARWGCFSFLFFFLWSFLLLWPWLPPMLFFLFAGQGSPRAFAGSGIGMGPLSRAREGISGAAAPDRSPNPSSRLILMEISRRRSPFHPTAAIHYLSDLGDLDFRQLIGFNVQRDLGFALKFFLKWPGQSRRYRSRPLQSVYFSVNQFRLFWPNWLSPSYPWRCLCLGFSQITRTRLCAE